MMSMETIHVVKANKTLVKKKDLFELVQILIHHTSGSSERISTMYLHSFSFLTRKRNSLNCRPLCTARPKKIRTLWNRRKDNIKFELVMHYRFEDWKLMLPTLWFYKEAFVVVVGSENEYHTSYRLLSQWFPQRFLFVLTDSNYRRRDLLPSNVVCNETLIDRWCSRMKFGLSSLAPYYSPLIRRLHVKKRCPKFSKKDYPTKPPLLRHRQRLVVWSSTFHAARLGNDVWGTTPLLIVDT